LQTVVSVEARWSVAQRVAGPMGVQPAGYEPVGYQSLGYRLKRTLLGRRLPTSRLVHERLRKLVALARLAFPIALAASATRTPPGSSLVPGSGSSGPAGTPAPL
jgi:hypothetical protein